MCRQVEDIICRRRTIVGGEGREGEGERKMGREGDFKSAGQPATAALVERQEEKAYQGGACHMPNMGSTLPITHEALKWVHDEGSSRGSSPTRALEESC